MLKLRHLSAVGPLPTISECLISFLYTRDSSGEPFLTNSVKYEPAILHPSQKKPQEDAGRGERSYSILANYFKVEEKAFIRALFVKPAQNITIKINCFITQLYT
jgi:hypothetical protein